MCIRDRAGHGNRHDPITRLPHEAGQALALRADDDDEMGIRDSLKDGYLQQCDAPRYMYDHPANVFVAGFIGSPAMNLLDVPVVDGGVKLGAATVAIPREILAKASGSRVTLGVRPEDLDLSSDGTGLQVAVAVVEELGACLLYTSRCV